MSTYTDTVLFPVDVDSRGNKFWLDRERRRREQGARLQRVVQLANAYDYWLDEARHGIDAVGKTLAEATRRSAMINLLNKDRHEVDSRCFHAWQPRFLEPVQAVVKPEALVPIYRYHRSFIQPEDEVRFPIRKIDGVYRRPGGSKIPIKWRDENNLLIISGLEAYKIKQHTDCFGGEEDDDDDDNEKVLLFTRNWPMVEKNKGKSFLEFIKR